MALGRDDRPMMRAVRRELGHLIFQLVHKKPIRLLFDRVVENGEVSLESCFQGALLGILFTPTHITFFKTPQHVTERSLLALYGGLESDFIHSDDPFSAQVKQRGYTYGDALKADDYPLIYR